MRPQFKNDKELSRFYGKHKDLTIGEIRKIVSKTYPEIKLKTNKGIVGQILEGLIGNAPNSDPNPDVRELAVELKVLPLRKISGVIQPKERSKLKSINFNELLQEKSWTTSKLRPKMGKILFLMYEQPTGMTYKDWEQFKFFGPLLYILQEENEDVVENDWNQIKWKVENGKAMGLSEGDGAIMGACTSGTGKISTYGKGYECKQRSYALKHSYLKKFYAEKIEKKKYETSTILKESESPEKTLIELLRKKLEGNSLGMLSSLYDISFNGHNKSAFSRLIKRIFNVDGNNKILELELLNVAFKTVPVNAYLRPWEAMSFPKFSLVDLLEEKWYGENDDEGEDSGQASFRTHVERPFVFIPVIKNKVRVGSELKFEPWQNWKVGKPVYWEPSDNELAGIKKEWTLAKRIVQKGVELEVVKHGNGTRQENNLLKQASTRFIHLRPHAKNAADLDKPYAKYTKNKVEICWQSFWFNKGLVERILNHYSK